MQRLFVDFTYFFLLIRRRRFPIVRLPNGHLPDCKRPHTGCLVHETTWTINGRKQNSRFPLRIEFLEARSPEKGEKVDWAAQGQTFSGNHASKWPDKQMLLHLDQADGKRRSLQVKPPKAGGQPVRCNVEIILPRGRFQALGAAKRDSAFINWTFLKKNQSGKPSRIHVQYLSDLMQFQCAIKPDRRYAVRITSWRDTGPQTTFTELERTPDGSIFLSFKNDDSQSHRGQWNYELGEYKVLYSFLKSKDWSTLPLPTATAQHRTAVPARRGEERPICGGAQGDGDDDPPVDP